MNLFSKWASHEHSFRSRVLASIPAGFLFVFLIPYTLIALLPRLDDKFHFPALSFGIYNYVFGGILILLGFSYAIRSIGMQLFKARGTPLPMMPTHELLDQGVFSQCRNPMVFGTICIYLGISFLVGSLSSIIATLVFMGFLFLYVKTIEEKELAARFGEEYIIYKAKTPFFFPRVFKSKKG